VVERDGGGEVGVAQVVVEFPQGGGHGERLVGEEAVGESGEVDAAEFFGAEAVFDAAAGEVETALESGVVAGEVGGAADEQVPDGRARAAGDVAEFYSFSNSGRCRDPADPAGSAVNSV